MNVMLFWRKKEQMQILSELSQKDNLGYFRMFTLMQVSENLNHFPLLQ